VLQLRALLQLQPEDKVVFERYSDSQSGYVTLDPDHPQVYKTLFRAAKAKLKLRLKATLADEHAPEPANPPAGHFASAMPILPVRSSTSPVIARTPIQASQTPQPELKPQTNVAQFVSATQRNINDAAERVKKLSIAPPVQTDLAFRPQKTVESNWLVFCNSCENAMPNEHYHCNICENGDYDLCLACVDQGVHCPGEGHWMVKRFVKNGCVEKSTTERITNEFRAKQTSTEGMPGAFMEEKQPAPSPPPPEEPDRTCNCCVKGV
jgi:next-to-BRCA1 protein 1